MRASHQNLADSGINAEGIDKQAKIIQYRQADNRGVLDGYPFKSFLCPRPDCLNCIHTTKCRSGEKVNTLSQYRRHHRRREVHKHPLNRQHYPAGRSQCHQAENDDLEQRNAQNGFDHSGADDVCLVQANLLNPAADVEGIGKANQAINDRQI